MTAFEQAKAQLKSQPKRWLITGCAGFIGSNLLESLLRLDQIVIGIDDFSTGLQQNLDWVASSVSATQWQRFTLYASSINDLSLCHHAVAGVDYVLHQAASVSVPLSVSDPIQVNQTNIDGFLNILVASRDAGVKRFVYAASSASYGDQDDLPKSESSFAKPLSPYALTKYVNELYADVFSRCYGFDSIGLRYFNIFGRRQSSAGSYAAVIPLWFDALLRGEPVYINGDGLTTRDFCYIDNVVQANILAATSEHPDAANRIYNTALGEGTTLTQLFELIRQTLLPTHPQLANVTPQYRDFRAGDVRHSQANIDSIKHYLGFAASHSVAQGITEVACYYLGERLKQLKS